MSSLKVTLSFWGKSWLGRTSKKSLLGIVGVRMLWPQMLFLSACGPGQSQLCGHGLPCMASTELCSVGDGSVMNCPFLMWPFPVCSWLSQEFTQMALESCVKMDWALKSSGKDTSSPVPVPCAGLCPVHHLHKDDWGCPHTGSCGDGTEMTTFLRRWRGSLPLHCIWRRNCWLLLCFLPALLALWERRSPGMWLLSLPLATGHPQGSVMWTAQVDTELAMA